jgi:hypothetical protein
MPCKPHDRESFLIRLWAEDDDDHHVLRGFIQNVQTGSKTYFDAIDLPVELLRESAERLVEEDARVPLR